MGTIDADGVASRPGERAVGAGRSLRRVAVSQELTVDAALTGDRTTVFEASSPTPWPGACPYEEVAAMTGEMLSAAAPWLPQFWLVRRSLEQVGRHSSAIRAHGGGDRPLAGSPLVTA